MKIRAELNAEKSISSAERLPQESALVGSGAHRQPQSGFYQTFYPQGLHTGNHFFPAAAAPRHCQRAVDPAQEFQLNAFAGFSRQSENKHLPAGK